MKNFKNEQAIDLAFNQQYSLSRIKRQLYQMIINSRRGEESGYSHVAEALEDLTFHVSHEEYKNVLLAAVEDMITLDDVAFDIGLLRSIKIAFTEKS